MPRYSSTIQLIHVPPTRQTQRVIKDPTALSLAVDSLAMARRANSRVNVFAQSRQLRHAVSSAAISSNQLASRTISRIPAFPKETAKRRKARRAREKDIPRETERRRDGETTRKMTKVSIKEKRELTSQVPSHRRLFSPLSSFFCLYLALPPPSPPRSGICGSSFADSISMIRPRLDDRSRQRVSDSRDAEIRKSANRGEMKPRYNFAAIKTSDARDRGSRARTLDPRTRSVVVERMKLDKTCAYAQPGPALAIPPTRELAVANTSRRIPAAMSLLHARYA